MIDFSASPTHEFGPLCEVLAEVKAMAESEQVEFMLIGAYARDLIHRSLGFDTLLARSTDVDIAILVPDQGTYRRLVRNLVPEGDSRIRFRIGRTPVDLIPFGDIERPPGTAVPSSDGHQVDVFAMREVFAAAEQCKLPNDLMVRIPTPAGYAALKLKAWADIGYLGWTKHARDLNYVCGWYRESEELNGTLYDFGDRGDGDLTLVADFDSVRASMFLLGRNIRGTIGEVLATTLGELWTLPSRQRMAAVERDDPFVPSRSARDYDQRLKDFDAIHAYLMMPQRLP